LTEPVFDDEIADDETDGNILMLAEASLNLSAADLGSLNLT